MIGEAKRIMVERNFLSWNRSAISFIKGFTTRDSEQNNLDIIHVFLGGDMLTGEWKCQLNPFNARLTWQFWEGEI